MKSEWHPIIVNPPEKVKEETYSKSFDNFDGKVPVEFNFDHTAQVKTEEVYTQTQRFDVSVNANIPVSPVYLWSIGGYSC